MYMAGATKLQVKATIRAWRTDWRSSRSGSGAKAMGVS